MRHVLAVLLTALPAFACGDWFCEAEDAAKSWYEGRLAEEKRDLALESVTPVKMRGPGAERIGMDVMLFDVLAKSNREGVFDADRRTVAVTSELKPWEWKGSIEDLRAVLDACSLRGRDEASMKAAAAVIFALPDGPGFDSARASVLGQTLTYCEHRATGMFGCGFMGWWYGNAKIRFDDDGRLDSVDRAKTDMNFDQYCARLAWGDPLLVDEVAGGAELARRKIEANEKRDRAAREAYASQLPEAADAWEIKSFRLIPLAGAAAPLAAGWRLFRADSLTKSGTQAKYELVFAAADDSLLVWDGSLPQTRRLLDRAGLKAKGGDSTRQVVAALMALPEGAWDAEAVREVEMERIEVRGKGAIWHEHRMWFGSGVLGGYVEDIEFVFDDGGLPVDGKTTGVPNLDVETMNRLLAEADPWLTLEGFYAPETERDLKKAQAKKEKKAPRHGEGK